MIFNRPKGWIVRLLIMIALLPIILTTYDVITTQNSSVNFLGRYDERVVILIGVYYLLLLGLGIHWFIKQIIAIKQLKNERSIAELMLLKSQVNPHFFFNMLNTIYGWIAKDAGKAQALILKLSDVMRYSIYEGEKEKVSLDNEILYLKNYIELQTMRYQKKIMINFDQQTDKDIFIAPLLYIILLENAFKHGADNLRENAYITINIASGVNDVTFTIENNFNSTEPKNSPTGIGLKNLKRRLELIYPNKHELSFSITAEVYKVQLTLTL